MSLQAKDIGPLIKKQPAGFICGFVSLCLVLVLYFRSDAMDDQTQARDAARDKDARLSTNIKYAESLEAQLTSLQAANKEAMARVVHPRDLSLNLQYLYRIESETGVKDQGPRHGGVVKPPGKAPPKTAYVSDAYSLTAQGEFRQLVDLLQHIEQGSHFSREMNAVIAPASKEDPTSTKLTLILNLELLAQPTP